MPSRRSVTVGAALAGVGYAVWLSGDWDATSTNVRMVSDLVLVAFALFATGCATLAATRRRGRERAAWACMAVATAGWAAGCAGWSVLRLAAQDTPLPWWANIGYLTFLGGAAMCVVWLLSAHSPATQLRLLLDGLVVSAALFAMVWVTALKPVYLARTGDPVTTALSLVYPVGDIVLIAIAVLLLVRAPAAYRPELSLLSGGFALITVSDISFAYFAALGRLQGHQEVEIGWALGLLGIGLAALFLPSVDGIDSGTRVQAPSRVSVWLPYVPVLASAALCAPVLLDGLGPVFIAAAVTVFAVMVRQLIVLGENRRLLVEVADHALRDSMTGLANRARFTDLLSQAVQPHQRRSSAVTVLLLDLDHFKLVNESLGLPAGDAMLVRVSERLTATVRDCDTVARLGGDEFAVLMQGDPDACRAVAHRVVAAFDQPFVLDGRSLLVSPSVGLSLADVEEADVCPGALLARADAAMNTAKRSRSSQLYTYSPEMDQAPGSAQLLGELRQAIEHFELNVVYQPKIDIGRDELVGLEALVRWPHPRRGLLAPDEFLPLVRRHGLMRSLTAVVLELALDDAALWYRRGVGVPVAVNVFAPAISDPDLPDRIVAALDRRGLPHSVLTVEITEDLLLENMSRTRTVFNRLREAGIRVAIDDFGSGCSALWYLREFPVDELKLDREFIAPALTHPATAAIVRSVIDLAHALHITPVAEGVENAETAAWLHSCGCDVAQGFHYSRPLPATAVLELLESQRCSAALYCHEPDGTSRSEIELMQ